MVYDTYIELVNGVYRPAYNWGAPLCRIHMGMGQKLSKPITIIYYHIWRNNHPFKPAILVFTRGHWQEARDYASNLLR